MEIVALAAFDRAHLRRALNTRGCHALTFAMMLKSVETGNYKLDRISGLHSGVTCVQGVLEEAG